jgi:carbonic anhydrase
MDLAGLLERNRAFVRGRQPRPWPAAEAIPVAIVACYDPRLDDLLLPCLGFSHGDAFLLRSAGALLRPGSSTLRSLGLAVYMFGVAEVIVLGHTSCRMARFDASAFIAAFRDRGVPREAFGDVDLRAWAGAIPSPARGVAASVAGILEAPFLPRDLSVAGLVLDDATGAVEVVVRPGERPAAVAAAPVADEIAAAEEPAPETATAVQGATPAGPKEEPQRAAAAPRLAPPPAAEPVVAAAESFLATLQGKQRWVGEARRLREELQRHGNPLARAKLLERFVHAAAADSREVRDAFERLRQEAAVAKRKLDLEGLLRAFFRRVGS